MKHQLVFIDDSGDLGFKKIEIKLDQPYLFRAGIHPDAFWADLQWRYCITDNGFNSSVL